MVSGNAICELPLFARPIERITDFEQYDRDNPQIWLHFEAITLEFIHAGYERHSAKAIFEVIRYKRALKYGKARHFKVNNNFTAAYARKFMRMYPQFNGFFETRKSKIDQN